MAKHGRRASIKLDNLAGVLTDISRKGTSVNIDREAELLEVTAFQADAKEYIVGFKDGKIQIEGNADSTIATHLNAILGESEPTGGTAEEGFDFEIGPEGTAATKRKYTGKCLLVKYSENLGVGQANKFSAELQCTGDVTVGAFA